MRLYNKLVHDSSLNPVSLKMKLLKIIGRFFVRLSVIFKKRVQIGTKHISFSENSQENVHG